VLRKSLFSRSVATRQMAVTGILLLLRTFKITTSRAVSQLSQSSGSLSQMAVDMQRGGGGGSTHDALCSELLGVLRRCFTLQAEVKVTLYHGLNDVVAKNPELCESVLELLYIHSVEAVGPGPELRLERALGEVEGGWRVVEPVGWFLHCAQMMVGRGQQLLGEENTENLDRLLALLEGMAEHYSNTDLADLEFEATDNFDRKTADGERRSLKADVLLTVYEALMEFVITHGGDSVPEKAALLLRLQQRHTGLGQVRTEAAARKVKGKKGKKAADDGKKDGEAAEKDAEKEPAAKRGRPAAGEAPQVTMPRHALSLKALSILLRSVLEDREPEHQAALTLLRADPAFPAWLVGTVSAKLEQTAGNLAVTGDEGPQSDILFRHLASLAASLFRHSVELEERVVTALLPACLALGPALQLCLTHFPRRRFALLTGLTDLEPGAATEDNLNPLLVEVMLSVLQQFALVLEARLELEQEEDGPRYMAALVTTFSLLLPELDDQEGVERVKALIARIKNSMNPEVLEPMVKLLFQLSRKVKTTDGLGTEVARAVHSLTGDMTPGSVLEPVADLPWLTRESQDAVLPVLLEHVERQLEVGDTAVGWCRGLAAAADTGPAQSKAEASVVILVTKQLNCCFELAKTDLAVGPNTDYLFKVLLKLFTVLDNLAKHFLARLAGKDKEKIAAERVVQAAHFDRMMSHMMDKQLTKRVYAMIQHLENKQNEKEGQAAAFRAAKKKVADPAAAKAKVLRDTKYIPNLILKIELLEKNLIKLGKKMSLKQGLIGGGKLTQARDFRIKISEDLERKLREDEDDDDDDDDEDEDQDEEEDSRLAPTGRSTLGDVTNMSGTGDEEAKSQEETVPGSPVLKKRKLKKKLQPTLSQMLTSSAEQSRDT
jgi:Fanconi anemia group I protein